MATQVKLRSREQILGGLVRTTSNDTEITSFVRGSDLVTLMEAISEAISQVEASALRILETINIDALVGTALDKKAISSRIPNGQGGFGRKPALQANGPVVIGSAFDKISSKLYSGKPAPFAGSTTLNVEDASSFPATGQVYIGRGTLDRFEGPIPYSSVVNNGSFWTITLDFQLTKNHLQSDLVTLSQGNDRLVKAGLLVQIPPNSETPAVNFATTQDLLIPDGEAEGEVNVIATQFGISGNALAGAISQIPSLPFAGATVDNRVTFRNGQSTESDEDLRQRIKNFPATLSRGTNQAIIAAIQGATDPDSGRSIQNSVILPPVEPGDFARVFIDDGTGLEPEFDNQPSELILKESSGVETQFSAKQFPITSAIIEGSESAPFVLNETMSITFSVDDVIETYTVTANNYRNLSSATALEVARDLNAQSNIVGFRTLDGGTRLVAVDLSGTAETIKVLSGDFQEVLGFPTSELSPIFLYKISGSDRKRLSFRGKTATLEMRPRNQWNVTAADFQDLRVLVDKVIQEFSVSDSDFAEFGATVVTATVAQWAEIFSRKIAGVRFTVSGQIIVWSTFQEFSENGKLEILETRADGSAAPWISDNKAWTSPSSGGVLSDTGALKDFDFNRFSGEVKLTTKPAVGDTIEIATRDTRAFVRSGISDNGLFSLSPIATSIGNSKLILAFDGNFAIRDAVVAPLVTATPTQPDAAGATNVIRWTATDPGVFRNAQVGDYMYTLPDLEASGTALPSGCEGFYRIITRGFSSTASNITTSSLLGDSFTFSSLNALVKLGETTVTVSFTDHGLRTGDLITIPSGSQLNDIGGIAAANLEAQDAVITYISDDLFTFEALAPAQYDAAGVLDLLGTNKIRVNHSLHGLNDGTEISTNVLAGFGGISAGALTRSNITIELIDANSYYYRATEAAHTSSTGNILTDIIQIADTWIEFEVSSPQLTAWTPVLGSGVGLTENMVYIFRSDGSGPQLVDFGNSVSSVTVSDIVTAINSQIASGEAVAVSPQQVEVRSSKYDDSGTCAILASIGNATNIFTPTVATAIQAHVAFSDTQSVAGGSPVISDIVEPTVSSAGYPTRTYLSVDRNITDILDENTNPSIESPTIYNPNYPVGHQHSWVTGRASGLTGRLYNNQVTAPYSGIMTGESVINPTNTADNLQTTPDTLDRYSQYGIRLIDFPVNNNDSLVFELDLDPTDKTVSVPMAKLATIMDIDSISGSGKGQVISFRLRDPEDTDATFPTGRPFFDSSSVYKNFSFVDFKMLTKSVGLYREDVSDRALIIRSVDYAAPSQLRFSIRFPSDANQSEFTLTHTTDFLNDRARLNFIATLPSDAAVPGAALGGGNYKVTSTLNGTLYDWRISSPQLNIAGGYVAGNVLSIGGSSVVSGSYEIIDAFNTNFTSVSASVSLGSATVTVTQVGHGLETGDLITISTTSPLGGITAVQLSIIEAQVTVTGPNTFTYTAAAIATVADTGTLDTITGGVVTVKSPGNAGLAPSLLFDAAQFPIQTYPLLDVTWEELATAINAFNPTNPIATAAAIGSDIATNPISKPTYSVYPAATAYPDDDMNGAFNFHSFDTHYSGAAAIFQYDSSNPALNEIKATVQTDEAIFPTISEASGTAYSPIGEEVQIVPTNTKSLAEWMRFRAVSSLNLLANIERHDNDSVVQLSSQKDGGDGAVRTTGVSANSVLTTVIGNASEVDESVRVTTLSADARSLLPGQLVKLQNSISSEVLRAYRDVPTGSSITLSNTETINTYFRPTNSIKYIQINNTTGRLVFLRNGQGLAQTEPLATLNVITLTDLGNGLVQVTSAQGANPDPLTGILSARTGDMIYIQPKVFAQQAQLDTTAASAVVTVTVPNHGLSTNDYITVTTSTAVGGIAAANLAGPYQVTVTGSDTFTYTALASASSTTTGALDSVRFRSPFALDARCKEIPTTGSTGTSVTEYLGYPVVHVIDDNNVIIIAPNITTFGATTLVTGTELVFIPAIYNEKNIRTNHREGAKFEQLNGDGEAFFLIKSLGNGLMSMFLQNSSAEATDDMLLDTMSVGTDDFITLGSGFDAANQGTFRIIAHNGRNHVVFFNASGGRDELIDPNRLSEGGQGGRKWAVGPLNDGSDRSVRIVSKDSVRIGDFLRISSPSSSSQWFTDSFFGSWQITAIGYQAKNYDGVVLPHSSSDGSYDLNEFAPYIEFTIPNAPVAVTDSGGLAVSDFLIGDNDTSIGFTEGTAFGGYRFVSGHAVNAQNPENRDLYLRPRSNIQKTSNTFGTVITALSKAEFEERTFQGIDGYKIYSGLVQQAHRIIDGLPQNTVVFPGVKAAGAIVEVQTSLIKSVQVDLQVRPTDGVTLNSITETVKAAVSGYVNALGPGDAVVLSEMIRTVQSLPGVFSVEILSTLPVASDNRIVVSETEKAFILDVTEDITVG